MFKLNSFLLTTLFSLFCVTANAQNDPNVTLKAYPEDPVIVTAANASSYKLAGFCDSTGSDVTVEFGTLTFTIPCGSFFGFYQSFEDVSSETTTNPIQHCVTQVPHPRACSLLTTNELAGPSGTFNSNTLEIISLTNGTSYPITGVCAPAGAALSIDIGASTGVLTGTCLSNNKFNIRGDVSSVSDGLNLPVTLNVTDGALSATASALVNKISIPDPAPFITAVTFNENDLDSNGWLVNGDSIEFTLNFSETVRVDSVVTLDFNLASGPKTAVYKSGSLSNSVIFEMNIAPGDELCSGPLVATGISQSGDGIQDLEDQLADTSAFPASFAISSNIDAISPSFGGLFNLASANASEVQSPRFNGDGFIITENCPGVVLSGALEEVVSGLTVLADTPLPSSALADEEYRFFNGVDGMVFSLVPDTLHRAVFTARDLAGNEVSSVSTNWIVSPAGTLPNLILHLTGQVRDSVIDEFGNDSLSSSFSGFVDQINDISESAVVHHFTDRSSTQRPVFNTTTEEIEFDGVNDCMRTGNHPELNTATVTERSYGLLFRSDTDITTRQTVFEEGAQVRGMNVYIDQGRVYCGFWNQNNDGDGFQSFVGQSIAISPNETYNIVPVFDYTNYSGPTGPDGSFQCYVNGLPMGSAMPVTSRLFAHSGDVSLGCNGTQTIQHDGNSGNNRQYFKGNILELMVFNTPPDDVEALDIYNYLRLTWDL